MVSDSDLVTRLHDILKSSDLDTATAGSVRRQLEKIFGVDLSDRKVFIREQIDIFLQSHLVKPEDRQTEEDKEERVCEESENVEHRAMLEVGEDECVGDEEENDEDEGKKDDEVDEEQEEERDESEGEDSIKAGLVLFCYIPITFGIFFLRNHYFW